MKRLIPQLIILSAIIIGCDKTEENIIWQGSFGQGRALSVQTTGDSGFVSVGESLGSLYLLYLDEDKKKVLEYKPDIPGILTSVHTGKGFFITAGSSGGKMLLSRINMTGTVVWDTIFENNFKIDHTSLCWLGGENFLALGTPDPDSTVTSSSGLTFLWFNSSGMISNRKDLLSTPFAAAKAVVTDNSGNIYLGLAKPGNGGNLKASVAKYNSLVQKIWEKDLYNNPAFGAASLGITLDGEGNPVVTGRTGMQVSSGIETNTFIAKYYHSGDSVAKNYLEYSNTGSSVIPVDDNQFYVLNRRCLIVNIVDQHMDYTGVIRTYSTCDSRNTENFGNSVDITSDGNLIISGSQGNNYYLVIKSSSALSPV